jgi:hypothetical protein
MTDIFLSYSSKDRELVRPLVEVLERHGWSVWWDQEIPSGTNFGKVIEKHLSSARCAIVAWTRNSVDSDWVRNEASEAHSRGALIPIALEKGVKFPLEFRQVETRDLSDWRPGVPHTQFERLFGDLQKRLSTPADAAAPSLAAPTPPSTPAPPARRRSLWQTVTGSWWYALTLLALPALFVAALAWLSMHWHVPSTKIELDVTVRRLRVQFSPAQPMIALFAPDNLRSLAVRNFARIEAEPACLSVVANAQATNCAASDRSTTAAIEPAGKQPGAIIAALPVQGKSSSVQFRPLNVATPASATFESDPKQPQYLTLKIDSAFSPSAEVLSEQLLRLTLRNARLSTMGAAVREGDFDLNMRTGNPSLLVRIGGAKRAFTLRMEPDANQALPLVRGGSWRIAALDLGQQADASGEEISALVGAGELRYADLPAGNKVALSPETLMKFAELDNFWLSRVDFDPTTGVFRVAARGEAKRLATFLGGTRTDRRLTWFDRLWNDPKLRVLFTIITFVLGATPGIVKLVSDRKRVD